MSFQATGQGSLCERRIAAALERSDPIPLSADSDGVIRLPGTRVTLDTVAEAFSQGATAEEIAQQYPTLSLAGVYSVLGHILRHRAEIAAYLAGRDQQRNQVRKENERRFDPAGVRARLLARSASGSREHLPIEA